MNRSDRMIIKINDSKRNNVAECELINHDFGIWYTLNKSKNVKHIFNEIKEKENELIEVLELDIDF